MIYSLFLGILPVLAVLNIYLRLWRNSFSTFISVLTLGLFALTNPTMTDLQSAILTLCVIVLEIRAVAKPLGDRFWWGVGHA